jgi:hypothetical protein
MRGHSGKIGADSRVLTLLDVYREPMTGIVGFPGISA